MSRVQYEGNIDLVAGPLLAHGGEQSLACVRAYANEPRIIQALEAIAELKVRNRLVNIIQRLGLLLGRFR